MNDRCKQQTRERNDDGSYPPSTTKNYTTTPNTPAPGTAGGAATPTKKGGRQLRYVLSYAFPLGPVPMILEVDAGLNVGMTFTAELVIDRSQGMVPSVGGQFGVGLYAGIDVNVFLGVNLLLARAGVEGALTIAKLDLVPAVRMLIGGIRDSVAGCWKVADSVLGLTVDLIFTGPSGSIGVAVYIGKEVCFFRKCWNLEVQVFSYTIAQFDLGLSKTWNLVDKSRTWLRRQGQPGACADGSAGATVTWASPDACASDTGEGGYCSSSSSNPAAGPYSLGNVNPAYKFTYTVPAGFTCANIQVNGNSAPATRRDTDFYRLYDSAGRMLYWKSGEVGVSRYKVCSPSVTVTLESGANVPAGEYAGITAFFEPAN